MIRCRVASGLERAPGAEAATDTEYERIGRLIESSELSPSPGEAHGILCGLVCGGAEDPKRAWLDEILPAKDSTGAAGQGTDTADAARPAGSGTDLLEAEATQGLGALADLTLEEIRGSGLALSILLPDDSRPLAERAVALYDWVRGFLFAFGVLGISERSLSEQGREILRDFAAITHMDLDDLKDDESNEGALMELTEHVRVSAMLLHTERAAAPEERR